MTRTSKLLGAVSSLVLVALSASPAFAEGTQAGTSITNEVSVTFQVNGIEQVVEEDTDTFLVDRKVNLTVVEAGGTATLVTPGSVQQVTTFTVTNLSNDVVDLALSSAQQDGGSAFHSGNDNFNTGAVTLYIDDDGTAGFSSGDSVVTYLDEVGVDESVTVYAVTSIAVERINGDIATVVLSATAHEGDTSGALGDVFTTSATNTANQIDTVLADGEGATDGEYDGVYSARDDYRVQAALLSVVKSSVVIEDPVSGTTNPKAIPGATVRYCIAVSNGAGAQTATNITVSDILPANMTFVSSSILLNGSVDSGGACLTDGVAGGTYDSGEVSGDLDDIAAEETLTLVFDVTID